MTFWKKVEKSVYGPEYYKELPAKPFSYSLSYFLLLTAAMAFFVTLVTLFTVLPSVGSFINSTGAKVLQYYPDDLVITIQNGKVSTNQKEPYVLALPAEIKNAASSSANKPPANLVVIDTNDPFSIDAFQKADTLLYLTKDSVVMQDNQGKITITPLNRVSNFKLDKPTLNEWMTKITPYFRVIYPVIAVGAYFIFFVGMALRLIYLFFFALLVWIVVAARKLKLGYKKSYQIGMHAITLPAIVSALLFAFAPQISAPFLFTGIALIVVLVNLNEAAPSAPATPSQPSA